MVSQKNEIIYENDNGIKIKGGKEKVDDFKKQKEDQKWRDLLDVYFPDEVFKKYYEDSSDKKRKEKESRINKYKKDLISIFKKEGIEIQDSEVIRNRIFDFLESKNATVVLECVNSVVEESIDKEKNEKKRNLDKQKIDNEIEKSIGVFYMNEKNGKEFRVINFKPKIKKILVEFYDNFTIEKDESGEEVYKIKEQGDKREKKWISYDEFENLMENYISTEEMDKEADLEDERKNYSSKEAGKILKVNGLFTNKAKKIELRVGTYKRPYKGKKGKKGKKVEAGTFSVFVNNKLEGYWSAKEIEKYIEENELKKTSEKEKPKKKMGREKETKKIEKMEAELTEEEMKFFKAVEEYVEDYFEGLEIYLKGRGYLEEELEVTKQAEARYFWKDGLKKEIEKNEIISTERLDVFIEKIKEKFNK